MATELVLLGTAGAPLPVAGRELVYTYEVVSEGGIPDGDVSLADDSCNFAIDSADLAPAEDVHDEALPYEVRVSMTGDSEGEKGN